MKAKDKLEKLKDRVRKIAAAYFQRVSSKSLNDLDIALDFAQTTEGVQAIYRDWREQLRLKNIATLPDLNQKPGQKAAA